jgi:predicted ATPase
MATRQSRRSKSPELLSAISVSGFKSIQSQRELKLASLNILAGANSAGKSSFIQPLLLLKQTVEATYDPGPLLIDGPNVKFTELSQIFSKTKNSANVLQISLKSTDGRELILEFSTNNKKQLKIQKNIHNVPTLKSLELVENLSDNLVQQIANAAGILNRGIFENAQFSVVRDRSFLKIQLKQENRSFNFPASSVDGFGEEIGRNIIHVPGLRGNPERSYKKTAVGDTFPGTLDSYAASIIAQWQDNHDPNLAVLGSQLQDLGLTWKVASKRLGDTRVELQVGRLPNAVQGGGKDLVSIADVGFGVSQILPVLVALLVAQPGQIVYIEQPETHLHPRAQRALAKIFTEAVKRNVLIIVETHSLIFVRSVQTLVAKSEVSKDSVLLHWVTRDKNGQTDINTAELDETGAYGDWPQDFESTELETEQDYIDAAEQRLLDL